MRDPNPLSGDFGCTRYDNAENGHIGPLKGRGEATGHYEYRPTTIEEEVRAEGWTPGARPTGPDPIGLFTVGMRGEPGYDDDPSPSGGGHGYKHPDGGKYGSDED